MYRTERKRFSHTIPPFRATISTFSLFYEGGTPLLTGTLKLHILALTFLKVNLFTLVHLASSHRQRMGVISLMGGEPLYKREP